MFCSLLETVTIRRGWPFTWSTGTVKLTADVALIEVSARDVMVAEREITPAGVP